MQGHGEKFTRKQDQAISALLSEPTIVKAAEATGVDEATLWRWLQREDFKQQYRQAKRRVMEHAITRLQQATAEAVECLREVMADREATDSSRVSAARTVLKQAIKAIELEELEARLERLETILERNEETA